MSSAIRLLWALAVTAWAPGVAAQQSAMESAEDGPEAEPAITGRLHVRPPIMGGIGTDGLAVGAGADFTHATGVRAGLLWLGFATIDAGSSTVTPYVGYEFGTRAGDRRWRLSVPVMVGYRWLSRGYEGGSSNDFRGWHIDAALEGTRWAKRFGFTIRLSAGRTQLDTREVDKSFYDIGASLGVSWRSASP